MRCALVHKLSSAYLDGALDDARASALRGHLRTCESCAERVAEEQALIRAASQLRSSSDPTIEPPAELWQAIGQRMAAEEIADSSRSPWRLHAEGALAFVWPFRLHLAGALGLCAVAIALLATRAGNESRLEAVSSEPSAEFASSTSSRNVIAEVSETHFEAAMREIRRADDRYLSTIGDLRELVQQERAGWPSPARRRYDRAVASFDASVTALRNRLDSVSDADPRQRDPLYALYRRHIEYLENLVFDRVSAVGSPR